MGNNQGVMHKRERTGNEPYGTSSSSAPGASSSSSASRTRAFNNPVSPFHQSTEDGCPVQVKIAKSDDDAFSEPPFASGTEEYPVVFKWHAASTNAPRSVHICGSWDNWKSKIPLVKSTSDFSTIVDLAPGSHQYKFLVDGKWVVDDNQPKTENDLGTENNVIAIDEADFEVFDALDKDLASSQAGEAMRNTSQGAPASHDTPNDRELEKLRVFTQEIPDRKDFDKAHNPPVLPPHLLQVILNKDTPVQCDPNVLPEPNHVMLNHLYALSIKDGVMVLSATHRYRKKYVTTLLYKPIQ